MTETTQNDQQPSTVAENREEHRHHRHHRHYRHRDPRKRFKYPDDEYTVNEVLSPLPRLVMQACIVLIIVAAVLTLIVNVREATGKPIEGANTILATASILTGTGVFTLLGSFFWGMFVWHYCPRWLFASTILFGMLYYLANALKYMGVEVGSTYVIPLLWLYSGLGLILMAEIFMTFTGRIIPTMLVFALLIVSGLVFVYTSDEIYRWISYALNTGLAMVFAIMLYRQLEPRNSTRNIMKS